MPRADQLQKTGGGSSDSQLLRGLLLPHTRRALRLPSGGRLHPLRARRGAPRGVARWSTAIALAVLRPEATNPAATNANVGTAILNHFAGGVALLIVIVLVKKLGEHFLRAACEGWTQFEITSKGVGISDGCGCEFIPWEEFRFTKIIPRKKVLCIRNGRAENLEPGEIEIRDGSVRCRGQDLDLGVEEITVQTTEFVAYRNAMGLGDVLLAPSLGILLGFNIGLFEMFLLASMTGTAHGLYLKRNDRRLPFGPHLMGATAYVILSRYHLMPSLAKVFGFPV